MIATRRPEGQDAAERRTTFVNLWQNPDGVLDAHRVAQAITVTTPARLEGAGTALLEVDGRHVGEVLSIPESKLAHKKWAGMQFARADLIRSALKLLDDGEVWVPGEGEATGIQLCRLGELGQVGPDRRDVSDGFERTDAVTAYPLVENHDTEQRRRLVARTGQIPGSACQRHGLVVISNRLAQLWPKAGRLLVAERLARHHKSRCNAIRYESAVKRVVAYPSSRPRQPRRRCGLVELQPRVVDHPDAKNQHRG